MSQEKFTERGSRKIKKQKKRRSQDVTQKGTKKQQIWKTERNVERTIKIPFLSVGINLQTYFLVSLAFDKRIRKDATWQVLKNLRKGELISASHAPRPWMALTAMRGPQRLIAGVFLRVGAGYALARKQEGLPEGLARKESRQLMCPNGFCEKEKRKKQREKRARRTMRSWLRKTVG